VPVRPSLAPAPPASSLLFRAGPHAATYAARPPADVATELNTRFPMDPATGQYFTLLYGVLDLKTFAFSYVSAGHPGPVHLRRDGTTERLTMPGFPIGLVEEATYQERTVQLQPSERLYLYSDGVPEALNPAGEAFGAARLTAALTESRGTPLDAGLEELTGRLR